MEKIFAALLAFMILCTAAFAQENAVTETEQAGEEPAVVLSDERTVNGETVIESTAAEGGEGEAHGLSLGQGMELMAVGSVVSILLMAGLYYILSKRR